jgi:hypothetical protein
MSTSTTTLAEALERQARLERVRRTAREAGITATSRSGRPDRAADPEGYALWVEEATDF